jgi:excisionase family DNA binding protein
MKPSITKFGMRENPASSGQHDSRAIVQSARAPSASPSTEAQENSQAPSVTSPHESPTRFLSNAAHTAATGGEARHDDQLLTVREVVSLLRVPVSWVYGRVRNRTLERLPAYRIGKYWRFRQDQVLAWVESRRRDSHVA